MKLKVGLESFRLLFRLSRVFCVFFFEVSCIIRSVLDVLLSTQLELYSNDIYNVI